MTAGRKYHSILARKKVLEKKFFDPKLYQQVKILSVICTGIEYKYTRIFFFSFDVLNNVMKLPKRNFGNIQ